MLHRNNSATIRLRTQYTQHMRPYTKRGWERSKRPGEKWALSLASICSLRGRQGDRICHLLGARNLLYCNSWQIIWQPFIKKENTYCVPFVPFHYMSWSFLSLPPALRHYPVCVCESTYCSALQSPMARIILSIVSCLLLFNLLLCRVSCKPVLKICQVYIIFSVTAIFYYGILMYFWKWKSWFKLQIWRKNN